MRLRVWITVLILATAVLLSACSGGAVQRPAANADAFLYDVAPRFREFYLRLGGAERLGVPISDLYYEDGKELQYTAAVLMVYDPSAVEGKRFSLAPLGRKFHLEVPFQAQGEIAVYEAFRPLYEAMGGEAVLGKPLLPMRYNAARGGIEQFFENAGFYKLDGEPDVHLLHYGAWWCAQGCGYTSPENAIPVLEEPAAKPFYILEASTARLGSELLGEPLSAPYISEEQLETQVFANVVVIADPQSGSIRFLPLPAKLNLPLQSWGEFETAPPLREFLLRTGGLELAGRALTPLQPLSATLERQCFETLCLDYDRTQPAGKQVRPVPLGRLYKEKFAPASPTRQDEREIWVDAWPLERLISPAAQPQVEVALTHNGSPWEGQRLDLFLYLPSGDVQRYRFPPTDANGRAFLALEPISASYSYGTKVLFQVCYAGGENICDSDHFVLWETAP